MDGFLAYLKNYRIYLASRSPRRHDLLTQLGIPFELWLKEDRAEVFPDSLSGEDVASYLARQKAEPYLDELNQGDILISADTIVTQGQEILGKPTSVETAREILQLLSGKEHEVITGVCISGFEKSKCFAVTTQVSFTALSGEDIEYYIHAFKPFDKAGAYGIQEWIGLVGIKSIHGSYFNVMGLPVHKLYSEIKSFTNYKKS